MKEVTSYKLQVKNRSGQVLLIAVMLLATIITVVMTVAFNSTSQTQVARLEADSQKALAAAEAGIDAIIKQPLDYKLSNFDSLGGFKEQGITGSAEVSSVARSTFVTPLMQKDEQYSFYLSDYPGYSNPWKGSFYIYAVSEAGQCPSIEVTVVKSDYTLDRYAYNTCSTPDLLNGAEKAILLSAPVSIDSVNFSYKTNTAIQIPLAPSTAGGLMAFVKVLNGRTKIGFESVDSAVPFPVQGKTILSEARTTSGVVKKVQLFQSFPQIPSDFFMTSF